MCNLEKFKPENYNKLTKAKKKEIIIELANEIFKNLGIAPIPVLFSSDVSFKKTCGKFQNHPACIYINSFFLDNEVAKNYISKLIDVYKYIPYQLVTTIAHECYHYYQFCLINKMVKGEELTSEEKDMACLYFVSLYERLFNSFCKKKGISIKDRINEKDLYTYSPTEIAANNYALSFVSQLGNIDNKDNYNYYLVLSALESFTTPNNQEESDEKADAVFDHNLKTALIFLKHKNDNSGFKAKYLDIDEEELMERVLRAKEKLRSQETLIQNIINKIHGK